MMLAARLASPGRTSGWFSTVIVETGRLPLFCFFVAFLVSFALIRLSVRMVRAQVRWWPGNVTRGDMHLHHMVFGVIFMVVAGVAGLAAPLHSLGWRASTAAAFGVGTALVLDEFAIILHLRDVYWNSAGRVSIDAVFIAAGVTALLLLGVVPAGIHDVATFLGKTSDTTALGSLLATLSVLFVLASVTLLKGKIWTGLFGFMLPFLFLIGAVRLARPAPAPARPGAGGGNRANPGRWPQRSAARSGSASPSSARRRAWSSSSRATTTCPRCPPARSITTGRPAMTCPAARRRPAATRRPPWTRPPGRRAAPATDPATRCNGAFPHASAQTRHVERGFESRGRG